jgi:hypothetical protein
LGTNRAGDFQTGRLASDVANFPRNIRSTIFGDDGAAALDDLGLLAGARRDALSQLNNSRSSVPIMNSVLSSAAPVGGGATVGALLTGGNPIGMALGGLLAEGGRAAMQVQGAKGLLAPIAQQAPAAMDDVATGLSRFLANPALADEASGLFSQPIIMRLAAEQRAEEERKKREALGFTP